MPATRWPCRVMFWMSVTKESSWVDRPAAGVTLSRKGAKSRTGGRKLRSTGTKARAHVSNGPNSLVKLKKQLQERTRVLARGARTADGNRRGAQNYQYITDRAPARAGCCRQKCGALLRSRRRDHFSVRRERASCHRPLGSTSARNRPPNASLAWKRRRPRRR